MAAVQINSTGTNTVSTGGATAAGTGGVAIGGSANSGSTNHNIAIGNNATAGVNGSQSVAIGGGGNNTQSARATGDQSIAIGGDTLASGNSSIAIGGDDIQKALKDTMDYVDYSGATPVNKSGTGQAVFKIFTGADLLPDDWQDTTASGRGSVAVGVRSLSSGEFALAFGTAAKATGLFATALGPGATADKQNSVAIGAGSATDLAGTKQSSYSYNPPDSDGSKGEVVYKWAGGTNTQEGDVVSFGKPGYERQLKNVSAGEVSFTSTDAVNGSQLYSIMTSVLDRDTSYFHVNSTDTRNRDYVREAAQAAGTDSIAAGPNASTAAGATNAIAMGKDVIVAGENSVAIGSKNNITTANTYVLGGGINTDVAGNKLGDTVANSVYLGNDSTVTAGSGSVNADGRGTLFNAGLNSATAGTTTTTAGATGTVSSAKVGEITYGTFAGSTAVGAVSVGAAGAERRIQNVAAGEISATSTDAINGSQLYAVAATPLTFTGNANNDTGANGTQQQLGSTLNITGAATTTGDYSAKNVKTVVTDGKVEIQIAENPEFVTTKIGGTELSTVGGALQVGKTGTPVKITNVANGENATDAVNKGQLDALGNNTIKLTAVGTSPTSTNTQALNKDGGLEFKFESTSPDQLGVTASGDTVSFAIKTAAVADNSNALVTGDQVHDYIDGKPITFGGDSGTSARKLGETFNIKGATGSGISTNVSGDTLSIDLAKSTLTADANGNVTASNIGNAYATAKSVADAINAAQKTTVVTNGTNVASVSSSTTGTTTTFTVNADGTTVSNGSNYVSVVEGTKNTTTNKTDFAVDLSTDTKTKIDNAADKNLSNITEAGKDVVQGLIDVKAGKNTTVTKDSSSGVDVYTVNAKDTTVTQGTGIKVTPTTNTATDITDYKVELDDATKTQLAKEESVINDGANIVVKQDTTNSTGGKEFKVKLADDISVANVTASGNVTAGSVTTGGLTVNPNSTVNMGDNVVSGVKDGNIAKGSIDAVNGSQLFTTNQKVADNATAIAQNATNITANTNAISTLNNNTVKLTAQDGASSTTGQNLNQSGGIVFDIQSADESKLTVSASGSAVTLTPVVGAVTAGNNSFVTGDTVNTAINTAIAASGFTIKANGETGGEVINPNDTVEFLNGSNIEITRDAGKFTIGTGKNVSFDQVAVGPVVINKDTGIDAGNKVITGVADGVNTTDAVNVGQLDAVKTKVDANTANIATNTANIATNTTNIAKGFNITADNKGTGITDKDNVQLGETVTYTSTDGNIKTTVNNNEIDFGLKDTITVGENTTGNNPVTINGTAGTVTGLTNKTWDSDNITNGRAATEDQLKEVYNKANAGFTIVGAAATTASDAKIVPEDTLKITGAAANTDFTKSDAGQNIYTVVNADNTVAIGLAKELSVDSVTAGGTKISSAGLTFVDSTGAKVDNSPSVTATGIDAGSQKITNVATGTNDNDAVNVAQLKAQITSNATKMANGAGTTVEGDGTTANPFKVNVNTSTLTNNPATGTPFTANVVAANPNDFATAGTVATAINTAVNTLGGNTFQLTAQENTSQTDAQALNKDGGLVFDIKSDDTAKLSVSASGSTITLTPNVSAITTTTDGKATTTTTGALATAGDVVSAVNNVGLKFSGDATSATDNTFTRTNQQETKIIGGVTDTSKLSDNNIGVVSDGAGTLTVKLAKDITVNSVKAGDSTLNTDGLTIAGGPSVTKTGINAGGQTITGVKAATGDTDAVNFSQLKSATAKSKTEVTSDDASIDVTESLGTNGQTIYDLSVTKSGVTASADKRTYTASQTGNAFVTGDTLAGALTNAIKTASSEVTSDDGSATINASNGVDGQNIYDVSVTKSALTLSTDGKTVTSGTTGNAFATGDDVANVVNKAVASARTELEDGKNTTVTVRQGANGQDIYKVDVQGDLTDINSLANGNTKVTLGTNAMTLNGGTTTVKIDDNGVDVGGKQVTKLQSGLTGTTLDAAAGDTLTNAVNVQDLKNAVSGISTKGISYKGNDGAAIQRSLGDTLNIVGAKADGTNTDGGKNIFVRTDSTNNKLVVEMAKNLSLDGVTAGGTRISADGLTFVDGSGNKLPDSPRITASGIDAGNNEITNVAGNLAGAKDGTAAPTTVGTLPTLAAGVVNNAATVGDVLNAGWNLQGNGDAKDFVKAYDTVDFKDGTGTTAKVTSTGTKNEVSFSVNKGTITSSNGVATGTAGDVFATASDVATAINNSGFNIIGAGNNGGSSSFANQMIKSGNTVTLEAGKNLTVTQTGGQFVFATADDVNFDKVTVGGVVLDKDKGIDAGNKQITGVASGLNGTPLASASGTTLNNAVNVGDLQAAIGDVNTAINNTGLSFSGDVDSNNSQLDNKFARTNQQETKIVGGVTDAAKLSDNNIGVVSNGSDTLTVKLAKDLKDLNSVSSQNFIANDGAGNSATMTATGTIVEDANGNVAEYGATGMRISSPTGNDVSLTNAGLNNGGNKLTNIADGVDDSDAVNMGQLNKTVAAATAAAKEHVESTDGSVVVKQTVAANGSTTFDLSVNTDDATIVKENGKLKVNTTTLTSTNGKVEAGNDNALATAGDIAKAINNSGFTLKTSATADGTKVSGVDEAINSGKTVEMVAGKNLTVEQAANGKVTYAVKDDVTFNSVNSNSVTAGTGANQVVLDNKGVNVGGNTYISDAGVNANNKVISNVADGVADTDAVNRRQLNAVVQDVEALHTQVQGATQDIGNLNIKMNDLNNKINDVADEANAGIAGAMAQGAIPQATRPGATGLGVGGGHYGGHSAIAVGFSALSDSGNWVLKGSVSGNTKGKVGVAVGGLYQW